MTLTWQEMVCPDPPSDAEKRAEAARWRPHCGRCGRWVSPKTVVTHHHWEIYNEVDYSATCGKCGSDVPVSWPE